MVKLKVKVDEVGCRKPGCKRRLTIPQRHHRGWETLFINAFGLVMVNSKRLRKFRERYEAFRPEDVVSLCDWHHAEIHHHYRAIVDEDRKKVRKAMHAYSWKQAERLMEKLRDFCLEWEKKETSGMNPVVVWPESNGRPPKRS